MVTRIELAGRAAAVRCVAAIAVMSSLSACAVRMQLEPVVPPCRTVTQQTEDAILWVAPETGKDRIRLASWCAAVGPIARFTPAEAPGGETRPVVVISWNMAVGSGDLSKLISDVRNDSRHAGAHFVFLLQEAYRWSDDTLPSHCEGLGVADRLGPSPRRDTRDLPRIAAELSLHAAYVPSMRNSITCDELPREDRGNAILSTLPLANVTVIELPFTQQRRVAVAATMTNGASAFTVLSLHFDTVLRKGRQARGVVDAIRALQLKAPMPVIAAGDFNGTSSSAGVRELRKRGSFIEASCGEEPTHNRIPRVRLDHVLTRNIEAASCETLSQAYGSDHQPLLARFEF
jgi:endonuclease/exonuclease/phosphatase family metal-dependent hydrolase